jgi:hypothetical protein
MSFDPKNGYTREAWTEFPDVEEASATLTGITGTAPNRGELITESIIATTGPNVTQQGSNVSTATPISAGWSAQHQQINNYDAGSVGQTGNKFS